METARHPCPWCGEAVLDTARLCPHCRSSALFDVEVAQPVDDGRTSYRVAREIAELPGLDLDFLTAKTRLDSAPAVLAEQVTRAAATELQAVLWIHEIATRLGHREGDGVHGGDRATGSLRAMGAPMVRRLLSPAVLAALAAVVIVAGLAVVKMGREEPAGDAAVVVPDLSSRELAQLAERATAVIRCGDRLGTGFFVADDLLVTNAHVTCGAERELAVSLTDGSTLQGRVAKADEWLDLAVITVRGNAVEPLELGDATELQRGDPIVVMGNPLGLDFTLSEGVVSHPQRTVMGISYLQIDAGVHPGNSGGPVFDRHGRVVGVVAMTVGSSGDLGLAIPVNYLVAGSKAMLAELGSEVDLGRWYTVMAATRQDDQREAEELRSEFEHAMLVHGEVSPRGELYAAVMRNAAGEPSSESLQFEVLRGDTLVCSPIGWVERWKRVPETAADFVDPRQLKWLQRHDLVAVMYLGTAKLDLVGCPQVKELLGTTLDLINGASSSRSVRLEVGGMR